MSASTAKLALALIVKGSDEEAKALNHCLEDVPQYVDGIFVTITQPNEAVEKVCQKYGANISHFEWINDFSAARNYNFAQVPKEYTHILWLDADDGLRGIEKLKGILENHPDVDTFIMNYLYAFDDDKNPIIVHMKTQIVKNDGCVKWVGAIHEDFKATRDINPWFIKDVERIHLSDGERSKKSAERNLEISKVQQELNPNDPRSWWNLANSYRGLEKYQDAIAAFGVFINESMSDEEKYLARLRTSECYYAIGNKSKAIDECRYAIGTKPEYPDAYHTIGRLYMQSGQYEQAIKSFGEGLTKKPPVHNILVYNPREYDYMPMKELAKAFWMISRPDMALPLLKGCLRVMPSDKKTAEIIKQLEAETKVFNDAIETAKRLRAYKSTSRLATAISKLPIELQSHPLIAAVRNERIIKEKSSGKDLVIYCANNGEVWNPHTAKTKGIGGSEEAVIWISKLLAKKGWNVEVYANCGTEIQEFDGVVWKPYWTWNVRDKQDVVILWRNVSPLKFDINAERIYADIHDVIPDGEFTPERLKKLTKVFVKSKFHRSLFPSIPDEKIVIVPNGIDASLFEQKLERDPYLLVNTSSADRSLPALLDCYAEVKKAVPKAKLKWAYGWNVWDIAHSGNAKMMELKADLVRKMNELGVEQLGRISHGEVAKLYMQANIFAYPSEFAEIDCISLSKAMASGAVPITTDFAAMGEKRKYGGVFIHSDKTKDDWAKPYQFEFSLESPEKRKQWTEETIRFLLNPPSEEARESMREWARETYSWNKIAEVWNNELK
ncbi:MAG: tetratricopeptide repeat protein [Patescibacteria group bacterium]|nr:tetratricopeptide repeat protein [Patescibacteria group bacterium]